MTCTHCRLDTHEMPPCSCNFTRCEAPMPVPSALPVASPPGRAEAERDEARAARERDKARHAATAAEELRGEAIVRAQQAERAEASERERREAAEAELAAIDEALGLAGRGNQNEGARVAEIRRRRSIAEYASGLTQIAEAMGLPDPDESDLSDIIYEAGQMRRDLLAALEATPCVPSCPDGMIDVRLVVVVDSDGRIEAGVSYQDDPRDQIKDPQALAGAIARLEDANHPIAATIVLVRVPGPKPPEMAVVDLRGGAR